MTLILVSLGGACAARDLDRYDVLASAGTSIGPNIVWPDGIWPAPAPIGLDAYAQWAMWPYQRIGVRSYMRSTHDRDGLNRTADASHFLYGERPDFNVTLEVLGRGVLYFVRTNRWHGSPWHYEVDGVNHVVRETSTADPHSPLPTPSSSRPRPSLRPSR
jgi:hypothetical protein